MSSSDVNAASLMSSINKKQNKHKSHLYNKTINMPRIQDIQFFFLIKKEVDMQNVQLNNKYAKNPIHLVFFFFLIIEIHIFF